MKIVIFVLCLAGPLCAGEKLRVLMIGNSYTAQTRQAVSGFLEADPEVDLELVAHAPGGAFLHQHADNPKVAALLEREWDVVVLQEQSQLPAFAMSGDGEARRRFEQAGLAMIRRAAGGPGAPRVLLFQTWAMHAEDDRRGTLKRFGGSPARMQDALARGYELLESKSDKKVRVVEVGRAFERWYGSEGYDDPALSLHRQDGSHPSKLGAYLTGAVFYGAITGKDPSTVEFVGGLDGLTAGRILKAALPAAAEPAAGK